MTVRRFNILIGWCHELLRSCVDWSYQAYRAILWRSDYILGFIDAPGKYRSKYPRQNLNEKHLLCVKVSSCMFLFLCLFVCFFIQKLPWIYAKPKMVNENSIWNYHFSRKLSACHLQSTAEWRRLGAPSILVINFLWSLQKNDTGQSTNQLSRIYVGVI